MSRYVMSSTSMNQYTALEKLPNRSASQVTYPYGYWSFSYSEICVGLIWRDPWRRRSYSPATGQRLSSVWSFL